MHPERILAKRILLADDQAGVRSAIRVLLQMDQHSVTEATNGHEALALFRRERFDLVITDYAMPEMPGSELALNIRKEVPSQPIIMITAFAQEMPHEDHNPVDAILTKPFSFLDLRETIARLLDGKPSGQSR